MNEFRKHFVDSKTPPDMTAAVLLSGLQAWIEGEPIPDISQEIPTALPALRLANKEQSEIGWDQMIWGQVTKRWADFIHHAQENETSEGYKTTAVAWESDWISILWRTMVTLWDVRNKSVFGATKAEQATILEQNLMKKVASLKAKGDLQTTKDDEYLTLSDEKISNMHSVQIMTWISNI